MRSSAAVYIFEAKLKQKKVDCKIFCNEKNAVRYTFYNEKMLYVTLFATKKCCMLHFLQRKNVKRHTFYGEKVWRGSYYS